jgi:hypothetical protein
MSSLILKRGSASRPPEEWRDDDYDYDVLKNGVVVASIFFLDAVGPLDRPWMWASGHSGDLRRAARGYKPTREAAMAAFALAKGGASRGHGKQL